MCSASGIVRTMVARWRRRFPLALRPMRLQPSSQVGLEVYHSHTPEDLVGDTVIVAAHWTSNAPMGRHADLESVLEVLFAI